jgi:hypothetical protein
MNRWNIFVLLGNATVIYFLVLLLSRLHIFFTGADKQAEERFKQRKWLYYGVYIIISIVIISTGVIRVFLRIYLAFFGLLAGINTQENYSSSTPDEMKTEIRTNLTVFELGADSE